MFVPCGKCDMCKVSKAREWINKIQDECRSHKFTFIINLDYSDEFLPRFDVVGSFLFEQNKRFYDRFDFFDLCIPLNSLNFKNGYDFDYFVDRVNGHSLGLPHCSVRDIQNFKKRLNKWFCKHVTGRYENFRSCFVSEYGPTTFRPHYHGIIWLDDRRLADSLEIALHQTWTFGHCYSEPDAGSFGSYIAGYINRPTYLPSCYSHPSLRPFFLFSKHPPLGSLLESDREIREIFLNGSTTRIRKIVVDGKPKIVTAPLSPSLKNRLFPKCPFFGGLDDSRRIELYRLPLQGTGEPYSTFQSFLDHLDVRFFEYWQLNTPNRLINCRFERPDIDMLKLIKHITSEFSKSSGLKRLYRISNRIYWQSQTFGVSFDFYVSRILNYYQNVEKEKLSSFYAFQEIYSRSNPLADLGFMYPERVAFINLVCSSLGLSANHLDPVRDSHSFRNYVTDIKKKYEESHKTMRKNSYFRRLRWKDPVLFNILNKFNNAKKCHEASETVSDSR